MPIYEYCCHDCERKFSEVLTIKEHETKKVHCPRCNSEKVKKVIEPFVAMTPKKSASQ
jgi:putative FmdB family regulatory protein